MDYWARAQRSGHSEKVVSVQECWTPGNKSQDKQTEPEGTLNAADLDLASAALITSSVLGGKCAATVFVCWSEGSRLN